ncbi:hypothetical protein MCOR29_007637 [Pyricularia oryzae]|nr:hypothetical protein MCOR01_003724 [Pyricularia oryzae]KAI6313542.1 hypothetical protein MCOR29_007637 [Pyricularia oryzae]KAI6399104.1 hypothetical protein MCOR20_008955 [Pyricularia oryzae]KAI6440923.1 hypothetical protein MCOR22_006877 [Pyricularia oryzae]KAI6492602.1 hypothetical protein MCOR11_006575 [Pyricularia oryzae]
MRFTSFVKILVGLAGLTASLPTPNTIGAGDAINKRDETVYPPLGAGFPSLDRRAGVGSTRRPPSTLSNNPSALNANSRASTNRLGSTSIQAAKKVTQPAGRQPSGSGSRTSGGANPGGLSSGNRPKGIHQVRVCPEIRKGLFRRADANVKLAYSNAPTIADQPGEEVGVSNLSGCSAVFLYSGSTVVALHVQAGLENAETRGVVRTLTGTYTFDYAIVHAEDSFKANDIEAALKKDIRESNFIVAKNRYTYNPADRTERHEFVAGYGSKSSWLGGSLATMRNVEFEMGLTA